MSQEEWRELIENTENKSIIDVRTPQECASGMIENARPIDFFNANFFMTAIDELDKDKSYFVYCRSGNRSFQACQIMLSKGIENVYNLAGGMMEWNGKVVKQ